jgi:hypothetical protein
MCGININKPEVLRSLDIYINQITNYAGYKGRFSRGFNSLENALDNRLRDIFNVFK